MNTRYVAGIGDGAYWNAGGSTMIEADDVDDAICQAEEWADDGDYPVDPTDPPAVELSLWAADNNGSRGENIRRWTHVVPTEACSGE